MSFAVNPLRRLQNMGFCEFLAAVDILRSRAARFSGDVRNPRFRADAPPLDSRFRGNDGVETGNGGETHSSLLSHLS